MLTFEKFTGINNVQPSHRLTRGALVAATNVDINHSGELTRRDGFSVLVASCHKNLWQADGFMLATVDGNNLVAIAPNDARTTAQAALGPSRVWYVNLPDGRTAFSNGLISGITGGGAAVSWGVPLPPSIGSVTGIAGLLPAGSYQYAVTYVRAVDGQESGPSYSNPVALTGGIMLTGLPLLAGHSINVYLSGQDGGEVFFAGNTAGSTFAFAGKASALGLPCRTEFLSPMPVGTVSALWRGRVLVASGSTLWASRPHQVELCDMRRDFKQFTSSITLIQPVDGGLFVGTESELAFLSGTEFDKLVYTQKVNGRTVLGSGVAVRGELIQQGEGAGMGSAMICIAAGGIVAGFSDGQIVRMTEGRYATTVTEVAATFRFSNGVPQYIATPQ